MDLLHPRQGSSTAAVLPHKFPSPVLHLFSLHVLHNNPIVPREDNPEPAPVATLLRSPPADRQILQTTRDVDGSRLLIRPLQSSAPWHPAALHRACPSRPHPVRITSHNGFQGAYPRCCLRVALLTRAAVPQRVQARGSRRRRCRKVVPHHPAHPEPLRRRV